MTVQEIKVSFVGQGGAGKTSLIDRIVKKKFNALSQSTIGVEQMEYIMDFENRPIKLILFDTAGQETYGSFADYYLRGTNIVLVCFDPKLDNAEDKLNYWKNRVDQLLPANRQILVSTKSDLWANQKPLPPLVSDSKKLLKELGLGAWGYYETSSLQGSGITDLLYGICTLFFENQSCCADDTDNGVDINKQSEQNSDKCSC